MDFERLMQQANANQLMTERQHERKKMLKDEEKRRAKEMKIERERKAIQRLQCLKETAHRKELEYKGLISSQGLVDISHNKDSRQLQSTSCTKSTSSHKEAKRTSAAKGSTQASTSSSSKKKDSTITKPVSSSAKKPASKTSSATLPDKPKQQGAPMTFAALMKVAEKNREERKDSLAVPSPSSSREASPTTSKPLSKPATQQSLTHHSADKSVSVTGNSKSTTKSLCKPPAVLSNSPKKSFSHTKSNISHLELTRRSLKPAHNSKPTTTNGVSRTGVKLASSTNQVNNPQDKSKQQLKSNPAKTNSFYGAANAKLLNQDRRALQTSLASRSGPVKHTSGWVSEMTEHLQERMRNGYFEREDCEEEVLNSDEEDFVTSDDDFIDDGEGAEDYSATIREIFGYDKRRFANERFDDAAMESSYAQQEFEEKRSARIGQLEDEEDVRAEREQMAGRKRKKEAPRRDRKSVV